MAGERDRLIAAMCQQFGPTKWWLRFISQQQALRFITETKERQEQIKDAAVDEAISFAFNCIHAGIAADLVELPKK